MSSEDDLNKNIEKYKHRLDELAWLLQGPSMCTAVAVIDKALYVSANEFSNSTMSREKNKQLNYIYKVIEHFSELAKDKLLKTENEKVRQSRAKLAKKLCRFQFSAQTKGGIRPQKEALTFLSSVDNISSETFPKLHIAELV